MLKGSWFLPFLSTLSLPTSLTFHLGCSSWAQVLSISLPGPGTETAAAVPDMEVCGHQGCRFLFVANLVPVLNFLLPLLFPDT